MNYRRKRSQRQEKRIAKKFGGSTRAGSGAFWSQKGDVRSEKFLIEAKRTDSNSYRISAKVWNKIRKEAIREGLREPMYAIEINGLNLVAVDYNCSYLVNRDRSYKLIGAEFSGGETYEIEKAWWQMTFSPKTLQVAIINLNHRDKETGQTFKFKLLVMREEDFFKLIPVV